MQELALAKMSHLRKGPARGEHGQRGSVLILALVAVLVVSMLAAGFLQLSLAVTRRQGAAMERKQAFYLAEAGLAEAYSGLALSKTGNIGLPERPAVYGSGLFWVEAERQKNLVQLESTGMYGSGRVTLGLVAEPVEILPSSLGLFFSDAIKLNPDTHIDSFDSSQGTYASQIGTALNDQAVLGSNGDVTLQSGNEVHGDVVAGPAGTVSVKAGAVVTGKSGSRPASEALPPIEVPPIPSMPGITHSGPIPLVIPPGSAGYDSLTVARDSIVIVQGPSILVTGDMTIESGGEMILDTTGGSIEVYVTGNVELKSNSSVVTPLGRTSEVTFLIASPESKSVFLGSSSRFHGFIYAPQAEVKLVAKFEVFGSIVAKGLNLSAQGRVHYDLAVVGSRENLLPRLHAWRVVDIPQNVARRGGDPFHLLGLDAAGLPKPADAHEDQWLVVDYESGAGTRSGYAGWESGFDWADVKRVFGGTRDGQGFMPEMAAAAPPAEEGSGGALQSLLEDPTVDSNTLKAALMAASPLSEAVLIAALQRTPAMDPSDMKNVMYSNGPSAGQPALGESVLLAVVASPSLDSGALKNVLIDASPVPAAVLQAAVERLPAMKNSDLNNLLNAQ